MHKTLLYKRNQTLALAGCKAETKIDEGPPIYDGNGRKIIMEPRQQLVNYCTMVPIDFIAQQFAAELEVTPNGAELKTSDITIGVKANQEYILVNEQKIALPVKPYILEEHLMVPLKDLYKALGQEISLFDKGIDNAIILGLYDDISIKSEFDNYPCIKYDSIPYDLSLEELLASGIEEKWQANNVLSFRQMWETLYFLYEPLYETINSSFLSRLVTEDISLDLQKRIDSYSYFIAPEVLQSQGYYDLLSLCTDLCSDIGFNIIDVHSNDNKIYGIFCFDLFPGMAYTPVVFEAELTKQPTGWLQKANSYILKDWPPDLLGSDSYMITKISNPRGYLNLQSFAKTEPENYQSLLTISNYLFHINN